MANNIKTIAVDLESRLKQYMPAMFLLLAEKNLKAQQWRNLNKRFVEEHNRRVDEYARNNDYLLVEANLYDLINAVFGGDKSALHLVGYIDVLFKALDKNLLPQEKAMVRNTIYNALINFDHKFRNFIGELAVLNNAVEGRRYSLSAIEKVTIPSYTEI